MPQDSRDERFDPQARPIGDRPIVRGGGGMGTGLGGYAISAARDFQHGAKPSTQGLQFGNPYSTTAADGSPGSAFAGDYGQNVYGGAIGGSAGLQEAAIGRQNQAGGYYQDLIEGRGPSIAQAQLQQQSDQNIQAQMGMMAQGRGGNLAGMQQQAGAQGVAMDLATNQQMGTLRAQEHQAALQGYTGLQNQMAQQALQQRMGLEQLAQQRYGTDTGAAVQREGMALDYSLGSRGLDYEGQRTRHGIATDYINAALGGIGGIMGGIGGM